MRINLSKPLKYRESELESLDLDLEVLTGQDLIDIEDDLRSAGQTVNMLSQGYYSAIAAKALHIPAETLRGLPLRDFMKLTNAVIFFLNDTVSTVSKGETSGE